MFMLLPLFDFAPQCSPRRDFGSPVCVGRVRLKARSGLPLSATFCARDNEACPIRTEPVNLDFQSAFDLRDFCPRVFFHHGSSNMLVCTVRVVGHRVASSFPAHRANDDNKIVSVTRLFGIS
jgi:hypothetical protein